MSDPTLSPAREASGPFSAVVVAALLAIGITAFGAFVVLGAYAPDLRGDTRGGNSALSHSAVGFAGLVDLLRDRDIPVTISRVASPAQAPDFLILTPPAGAKQVALATLPRGKTRLVVLPKWSVSPDDEHPGWVRKTGIHDLHEVASVLPFAADIYRGDGLETPILHAGSGRLSFIDALRLGPIDTLQKIGTGADWTPVLMTEGGQAILVRKTNVQPPLFVLSDPDLLDTKGLKDLDTARAALTIMDGLRANLPITFDVTLNGLGRSPNVLRLLFEPPLIGATLCATAAALLILIMALHRFGPAAAPTRVLDFGKRALADNSAGLIALAGRESKMAVPYAQLTRTLVLRDIGAPPRLSLRETDEFIDVAARSRGLRDTYADLASAAANVGDRVALIALAQRLHTWAQGLRRGHR